MIELNDWIAKVNFPAKRWLLLGKGPTFSRRGQFDLANFNTFALNHVVREEKVTVAHIIDIDVVGTCRKELLRNCDWLIMPRVPHVRCLASEYMNLADWLGVFPELAELEEQGRLVVYPLVSYADRSGSSQVEARYFSSEAAFGILGLLGVRDLDLLGVDGGRQYSSDFADLGGSLLVNQQPHFDLQFKRLAEIARHFGIRYSPLVDQGRSGVEGKGEAEQAKNALQEQPMVDPEILLPDVRDLDVPARPMVEESEPEFSTLVRAEKYAASYNYRHKFFPKSVGSAELRRSLAEKIEDLEADLRLYRAKLEDTLEELSKVSIDLVVCDQRLTWSRQEVEESRARILSLEQNLHGLVGSATWKVGRFFTNPTRVLNLASRQAPKGE
jgi:hypothetical protein